METIYVNKDSKLMQMIKGAKARKQAWEKNIKSEIDSMQKDLISNQQQLQSL